MCPWSQLVEKSASHVWAQKPEGLLKVNKINAIKHQSYCSSFSFLCGTKDQALGPAHASGAG